MLPSTDPCTASLSTADTAVTPDLSSQVQALLQQSRAAHQAKKHSAGRANKDGIVTTQPNYPQAEQHIREAIAYREQAEALDPDHTSPAWSADQAANKGKTSAELLDWFRAYLLIP